MIVVPEFFADRLVRLEPAARAWVAGLPELAARYAEHRRTESGLDDRFATVVDIAGLDPDRARAWTLVRAVQNWLWFVDGEDTEDFGWPAVQVIAPWAMH
ncbi:hypothetical protein [Nocardia sp. NPDC004604]|uniref:hypothetical protein n=1 Tax=Nocardia sp. NPDC004604 TaxID=3157013 RepID=UPI0033AFB6C5